MILFLKNGKNIGLVLQEQYKKVGVETEYLRGGFSGVQEEVERRGF